MKATALLRNQHGSLDRLLDRVAAERSSRVELVLELVEALFTHLSIEDTYLLCSIDEKLKIPIRAYRDQHALMRNAVLQTVFAEGDDIAFGERLLELRAAFREHALGVERDLLPLAESRLRPEELERLGERMQAIWNAAVHGDHSRHEPRVERGPRDTRRHAAE
ncbi:MAG TPA: hemerythrin domain-containing protein [Polyangiaceae bacterium]|nr:hemerythrin domain-containing protein [Polyangiaceae bacterium]